MTLMMKIILGEIEGTLKKQYDRLWIIVKRTNPGTTTKMQCDFVDGYPKFKRLYICLEACKKGFKEGCRCLVGLDGCHLKGVYEGQLLTACGIDANNETWVIAYAVVELESRDSWTWLELLAYDLNIVNQYGWTFISDKQTGLPDYPAPVSPSYTRQPGRPRKVRIKDPFEKEDNSTRTTLGKTGAVMTCGHCGQPGHNQRSCHRHLPPKQKPAPKPRGRPRKNPQISAAATLQPITTSVSTSTSARGAVLFFSTSTRTTPPTPSTTHAPLQHIVGRKSLTPSTQGPSIDNLYI
ncbi:hypothetical protein ACLB2K_038965 [Fragaria x ananassa]